MNCKIIKRSLISLRKLLRVIKDNTPEVISVISQENIQVLCIYKDIAGSILNYIDI